MEGNVTEEKVQAKQGAEGPTGWVPKREAAGTRRQAAQGSSPPQCRAQGQPASVDFRDVLLGGRPAAKAGALAGEERAEEDSV